MNTVADTPEWAKHAFDGVPTKMPRGVVSIRIGDLDFGCRLKEEVGAGRLIVRLLGTLAPNREAPAIQGGLFPGYHVLTISDPSLFIDRELRTGVFFGREAQDPIDGVVEIVTAVAGQLGLDPQDTLFYGPSGSGFAGIVAASKMGARAVAVNGQLSLHTARRMPAGKIILNMFRSGGNPHEIQREYPARVKASGAYLAAIDAGRRPRVAVYQNRVDVFHQEKFYEPFCDDVGVNPRGGVSPDGGLMSGLVDYPEGHRVPQPQAMALIERSLPFLYPEG